MGDSPRFTLYPSQQSIYHLKIMVYRIPFTLKFHPHNHAVKFVILKTLNYFKMTLILAEFFSQTPLISFQRHKNIGNLLVRSAFSSINYDSKQAINSELLNAHAHDAKPACSFIRDIEKISGSGPKRSIKISDRFTCTSANVIYCITCTVLYRQNRETTRRPIPCLIGAEKDEKNACKQVARHFNLSNHSTQHMAACGLSLHQ